MNTISFKGRQNDDLSLTGFKVRLVAPYFPDIPPEIKEGWVSGTKKAAPKAYQGLKKAIKTPKDFKKKIAKPVAKTIASFLNPKFVSRHELTYDEIMGKTRDSLDNAGKHYLPQKNADYHIRRFEENVELKQKEYARQWCKVTGPLKGYKKGGIKGLSALGVMAICGDPKLKNFLKERIDTMQGTPCAVTKKPCPTGQPVRWVSPFKTILGNQIVHSGSNIIKLRYQEESILRENQRINQLVNEHCREEIIQFMPGGASHIDFIVVEIPNPAKPGEMMKWLGLDIQVTTN
jgi:hypothetical protein